MVFRDGGLIIQDSPHHTQSTQWGVEGEFAENDISHSVVSMGGGGGGGNSSSDHSLV